jgi:hypothetical protein
VTAPSETDVEQQLAWEARQRPRAGIAGAIGAVGLIFFLILQQVVGNGAPTSSLLASLQRAVQPGALDKLTSLQVPIFQYLHDHSAEVLASGVVGLLGYVGLGWCVGFLGVVTRARRRELPRWAVLVAIAGGVVLGLGVLILQVAEVSKSADFLNGPRTVAEATTTSGLFAFGKIMQLVGSLMVALGLVLVALNAMRAGLLTRLYGVLGIITGATFVIFPLPIVQIFWLAALALLCFGLWPGGLPPAWSTGKEEPWPSNRPQPAPARGPAPAPGAAPRSGSSSRGKRKKRS